jgi:hypothetical protein
VPFSVRDVGGLKVAFVGVSEPELPGPPPKPPADAVKTAVAQARAQGVQIVVALASVGRGEAKRIADAVPELTAIVVGSKGAAGEANTDAPPAERVGDVIVVETGNHLQTMAVLDLYVQGGATKFADGTGLDLGRKRQEVTRRIDELRARIASWEAEGKIQKADLDARRADLAKLEQERAVLDAPKPAPEGSYFRYAVKEIREALGSEPATHADLLAYYKKVNDANRALFAEKKPPPAPSGAPSYVGIDACETCHDDPVSVWKKTKHAHAYETISSQFKEYNLDCVGCHVTGYDQPGGSTVTHVDTLKNVQCEVCHGPGSLHAARPKVAMPVPKPQPDMCLSCHHPPHVAVFDAKAKMEEILGPGHGRP